MRKIMTSDVYFATQLNLNDKNVTFSWNYHM